MRQLVCWTLATLFNIAKLNRPTEAEVARFNLAGWEGIDWFNDTAHQANWAHWVNSTWGTDLRSHKADTWIFEDLHQRFKTGTKILGATFGFSLWRTCRGEFNATGDFLASLLGDYCESIYPPGPPGPAPTSQTETPTKVCTPEPTPYRSYAPERTPFPSWTFQPTLWPTPLPLETPMPTLGPTATLEPSPTFVQTPARTWQIQPTLWPTPATPGRTWEPPPPTPTPARTVPPEYDMAKKMFAFDAVWEEPFCFLRSSDNLYTAVGGRPFTNPTYNTKFNSDNVYSTAESVTWVGTIDGKYNKGIVMSIHKNSTGSQPIAFNISKKDLSYRKRGNVYVSSNVPFFDQQLLWDFKTSNGVSGSLVLSNTILDRDKGSTYVEDFSLTADTWRGPLILELTLKESWSFPGGNTGAWFIVDTDKGRSSFSSNEDVGLYGVKFTKSSSSDVSPQRFPARINQQYSDDFYMDVSPNSYRTADSNWDKVCLSPTLSSPRHNQLYIGDESAGSNVPEYDYIEDDSWVCYMTVKMDSSSLSKKTLDLTFDARIVGATRWKFSENFWNSYFAVDSVTVTFNDLVFWSPIAFNLDCTKPSSDLDIEMNTGFEAGYSSDHRRLYAARPIFAIPVLPKN